MVNAILMQLTFIDFAGIYQNPYPLFYNHKPFIMLKWFQSKKKMKYASRYRGYSKAKFVIIDLSPHN